jgi:STE24 endopeptidase
MPELNFFFYLLTIFLVFTHLLEEIADYRNLRALTSVLPREMRQVYSAWRYKKAHLYTKANLLFGLWQRRFALFVLLVAWYTGLFAYADDLVAGFSPNAIIRGLLFFALLGLVYGILNLPWSIAATFGLESRFGFNRTTRKTFILDRLKGILLTIPLAGGMLAAIFYLFSFFGPLAWLYSAVLLTIFSFILQLVAPTWIMPLFNRFTPLPDGSLRDGIKALAKKIGFPLRGIFVIDGSRRSGKANAFFTGFGKSKRIALYDTLVEKHSDDELLAVLGHEIGHYKLRHIRQGMIISLVNTFMIFFFFSLFLDNSELAAAFGFSQVSLHSSLLMFALLLTPFNLLLQLVANHLSRRNEFAADHFAAQATGDATAMISALQKLSADNLANLVPDPFYVFLHYSHPPVVQRIRALAELK